MSRRNTVDTFWERVAKTTTLDCWLWLGTTSKKKTGPYGSFCFKGKVFPAHRFAYEITRGPIPGKCVLDHLCRNPQCVNPDHLEPVSNTENLLRGFFKNGLPRRSATHCKRGHSLAGDNLSTQGQGKFRRCKKCSDDWFSQRYQKLKEKTKNNHSPQKMKTHCKKGHLFDEENTRISSKSRKRTCRKCHAISSNERYYRKIRPENAGPKNSLKTHCKRGHELTLDNLYRFEKTGKRQCLTCWNTVHCNRNQGRVLPSTV